MNDRATVSLTALNFMKQALELLDNIEERVAALHLQHAIDVLTGAPIPRSDEEMEEMFITAEARALQQPLG